LIGPAAQQNLEGFVQRLQASELTPDQQTTIRQVDAGTRTSEMSMTLVDGMMLGLMGGLARAGLVKDTPPPHELDAALNQMIGQRAPMIQSQAIVSLEDGGTAHVGGA
jgi:hypothetical protein